MQENLNAVITRHKTHISVAFPDIVPDHVNEFKIKDGKLLVTLRGLPTIGQIIARENKDGRSYDTAIWSGDHALVDYPAPDQVCCARYRGGDWCVEVRG